MITACLVQGPPANLPDGSRGAPRTVMRISGLTEMGDLEGFAGLGGRALGPCGSLPSSKRRSTPMGSVEQMPGTRTRKVLSS